jgi:Ca2+-binding EF-hand superfamily protein
MLAFVKTRARQSWQRYKDYGQLPWQGKKSKVFVVDEAVPGCGAMAYRTFRKLQLNDVTIQRFYNKFQQIDTSGDGTVSLDEFYGFFAIRRSAFGDRVFGMLDLDKSGAIDFREFVLCMWNFCTYEVDTFIEFAFRMYDLDGSEQLEMEELRDLVEEVYGDMMANNVRVTRILDVIDADGDGVISFSEFLEFNRRYPALLFPAYSMQNELRRRCFGEGFWQQELSKRVTSTGGRVPDVFDMLDNLDGGDQAARGLDQLIAMNEYHEEEAKKEARLQSAGADAHLEVAKMAGGGGGGGGTYDPGGQQAAKWADRARAVRREALLKAQQKAAGAGGSASALRYEKVKQKRHDLPCFLEDL